MNLNKHPNKQRKNQMEVTLHINGKAQTVPAAPTDTLIAALRQAGYFSVRFGSADGQTGAAAVLLHR